MNSSFNRKGFRAALFYLVFAILLFLISDRVVGVFVGEPNQVAQIQSLIDWVLVFLSAFLIYIAFSRIPAVNKGSEEVLGREVATQPEVVTQRPRQSNQKLELVREIEHATFLARMPEEFAKAVLLKLMEIFPKYTRASFVEFNQSTNEARFLAVVNGLHDEGEVRSLTEFTSPEIMKGEPVRFVLDVERTDTSPPIYVELKEKGIKCFLTATLVFSGNPIGEINLASDKPNPFDPEHFEILAEIASPLAKAFSRTRLNRKSEKRIKRLNTLRTVEQVIATSTSLSLTLDIILEIVITQLGVDSAILLLSSESTILEFAAGRGFDTSALRHTFLRLGEGYAGAAALEHEIIFVEDLQKEIGAFQRSPLLPEEKFVSYCAVPMIVKGRVNGVLEVFTRSPLKKDQDWLDFLDDLAGQTGMAIENALMLERVRRQNFEMINAYDSTLEILGREMEIRNHEVKDYSRRVTELTVKIARKMGVSKENIEHIRRGALLHDIGKIGLPENILSKPGSLTEGEWEVIRLHPEKAYRLLSEIEFLRPALDIPYCHHEKWDGTGYPRGLKGELIPLPARIFAVVDVWCALTSDRPYRKVWTRDKALKYIQGEAGTHFDPKIVDTFLKVIEEDY